MKANDRMNRFVLWKRTSITVYWGIVLILFSSILAPTTHGATELKPLTLEQVLLQGVDGNEALRNATDKLISKRLETQALKEKQIKEILDYPIEKLMLAKLSEDAKALGIIERQATIQNLDLEIIQLEIEIDKSLGDLCKRLRQNYYDILIQTENLSYETQQVALLEPRLAKATQKYQLGLIGKTSVSPLQQALLDAQEGAFKAETLLALYSLDLAKNLGLEDLSAYKLIVPKPVAMGNADWFKAIKAKLTTDNAELLRAELDAQLATRDFEALLNITENSYGGQTRELELLSKAGKTDYKAFFERYEKLLATQRLIPEDFYPLNLGSYVYRVPITAFKTPLKPIEYLQKERYPLQYALNNRDIKQEAYQTLFKQTQSLFEQAQANLTKADKLRQDNDLKLKDLQTKIEVSRKLSLLGQVDYSQVIGFEDQVRTLSHLQVVGSFEVQKSLADLEKLVPRTVFKQLESERTQKIKRTAPTKGQWAFDIGLGHFTWQFSIKLPQGSPVIYYELWQGKEKLHDKLPVTQVLMITPQPAKPKAPEDKSQAPLYTLKLFDKNRVLQEVQFKPESAYGEFEVK